MLNYDNNEKRIDVFNSLISQSPIPSRTKPSRITDVTATLIDNILSSHPIRFVSGLLLSDIIIWPSSIIYSETKLVFKEISNTLQQCEILLNQWLDNDKSKATCSSIDLHHISVSDNNCTVAMESLAHAVDNTYKQCCPIKSKTGQTKTYKSHRLPVKSY